MDRRAVGGVVLLLAAICLLVVPRLTTTGVIGVAAVDPGDPPPALGTCVGDPVYPVFDERGWMRPLTGFGAVACDEPHWGEIVAVTDLTPTGGESGERLAECWGNDAVWSYLSGGSVGRPWTTALSYDMTALGPDAQQFAAGQRWVGCVLHGAESFTGSLAGVAAHGDPPPTLGLCYQDELTGFDNRDVPCRGPHRAELFEYRPLDVSRPSTQAEVDAWCAAAAVQATGRTGLGNEPGLSIQTGIFAWFDDRQSRFVSLPLPEGARGATALCGVQAVDGRVLTLSLRQIFDAPLPWAG